MHLGAGEVAHRSRDVPRRAEPKRTLLMALLAAGCLLATSCAGSSDAGDHPEAGPSSGNAAGVTIPQPQVPPGVPVAPDSERVDLKVPRFAHPTVVDNPLFPVSRQKAVVFVGHVDSKPFRTEVTLLPFTRVVDWGGQRIETLVSQYTAYLGGRIQKVAYDFTRRPMTGPSGTSAKTLRTSSTARSPPRKAPGWPARTAPRR
jgi:hypothetical protein